MKNKISLALLSGVFGLFLAAAASAEVEVTFSHKNTPDGTITEVFSVADGENIKVVVTDTNTTKFDCEVTGIELVPAGGLEAAAPTDRCEKTIEHSAKFGGYYVRMKLRDGETKGDFKAKTWIIATQETGWHTDVQVGLVGSWLVSPKYYLDTGDDEVKRVFQDREAEDDVELGFASFATVYHDRRPRWGLSLGLGINDNDLSVLLGPTLRLGQRAAITAGYGWGQVDRLPTGLEVGDPFEQDNLTLESSTRGDWFFSISIRGFTDAFQKKLATKTQTKQKDQ